MKTATCQDCGATVEISDNAHSFKRCSSCKRNYNREYKRAYMLLAHKFCDCGQPATTIYAGERCCDRCKRIDQARDEHERERVKRRADMERAEYENCGGWAAISRNLQGKFEATEAF